MVISRLIYTRQAWTRGLTSLLSTSYVLAKIICGIPKPLRLKAVAVDLCLRQKRVVSVDAWKTASLTLLSNESSCRRRTRSFSSFSQLVDLGIVLCAPCINFVQMEWSNRPPICRLCLNIIDDKKSTIIFAPDYSGSLFLMIWWRLNGIKTAHLSC
jgi:hypothetical protein